MTFQHQPLRDRKPTGRSLALMLLGAAGISVCACKAAADILPPFYDRDSWVAAQSTAQGESSFDDFETTSIPLGYFAPASWGFWADEGVRFTSLFPCVGAEAGSENPNGWNLATTWGVDPSTHVLKTTDVDIEWDVTRPANAIAIEIATLGYIRLDVTYSSGAQAMAVFLPAQDPAFAPDFIGVVGVEPIVRVTLQTGIPSGATSILSYIKSFSFGTPVPTPSAALLLAGAALCASRRRR